MTSLDFTCVLMFFALVPNFKACKDSCKLDASEDMQQIIAVCDLPHREFYRILVSLLSL